MAKQTELNLKQQKFVAEYLIDLNAKAAAIRAGYSAKTAQAQGARLLSHVLVSAAIAKKAVRVMDRAEITAANVVRELGRIAFSEITDFADFSADSVTLKDCADLTEAQRAAIGEVSETKHGVRFKLHSKMAALDMLGRHFALFTEIHEVNLNVTLPEQPEDVKIRIAAATAARGDPAGLSPVESYEDKGNGTSGRGGNGVSE